MIIDVPIICGYCLISNNILIDIVRDIQEDVNVNAKISFLAFTIFLEINREETVSISNMRPTQVK
ncbi:hypothetical protein apy_02560 [Aeropyrum pernix]|uniref:Uncharacterized protein n=1 Tax=Aeropyrum pernix TaxID=56636 RepID=A0A401H7Z0_AERPX|nr:hypothetical protein apy_02560 [Aeropyrum pernix]